MASKRRTNARRSNGRTQEVDVRFQDAIVSYETPKKKFSIHDLNYYDPLTYSQELVYDLWEDDYNIILNGFAGCGKSFCAIYLGMREILSGDSPYNKLVIIRTASPTKDSGFLPGTLEEKNQIYELPYESLFNEIFKKKNQYKYLKESGVVEFTTTSYLRGLTYDNAIIVFDEFSSATYHELATVVTRVGRDSKIVLCGDENQNDIIYSRTLESGFTKFMKIASMMSDFRTVNFTVEDCVRSGFVKSFLVAEQRYIDSQK